MLQPGDPAPTFSAPDQTGAVVSLEDLRGRYVVLWFYPMANTPG
jgi:peroxiredoxin Q/BCP